MMIDSRARGFGASNGKTTPIRTIDFLLEGINFRFRSVGQMMQKQKIEKAREKEI